MPRNDFTDERVSKKQRALDRRRLAQSKRDVKKQLESHDPYRRLREGNSREKA